jgi:hypothetical protein
VPLIQPESAGRRSLPPELRQFSTLAQEGVYLAKQSRRLNKTGGRAGYGDCLSDGFYW